MRGTHALEVFDPEGLVFLVHPDPSLHQGACCSRVSVELEFPGRSVGPEPRLRRVQLQRLGEHARHLLGTPGALAELGPRHPQAQIAAKFACGALVDKVDAADKAVVRQRALLALQAQDSPAMLAQLVELLLVLDVAEVIGLSGGVASERLWRTFIPKCFQSLFLLKR